MEILFFKYAHIIAMVYWLGGDLGTFFASKQVINRGLSPQARQTALKIMLACDQGPKIAMPLIFVFGVHLASLQNVMALPPWGLAAVWLVSLWWLGNVLYLHHYAGKPLTQWLAKFDLYFRMVVVLVLLAWSVRHLSDAGSATANWVIYKLLVFAALVGCGIGIRIYLRPFVPAFGRMMREGSSRETDDIMHGALMRCRPLVWCIWLGLLLNAALGVHLLA
ncbi:MAG: hypothetical protein OXC05_11315 [Halieaceae bacterium]|nr:hypothetical protein [Halieaceae bacterium]